MRLRASLTILGLLAVLVGAVAITGTSATASDGQLKRAVKGQLKPAVLTEHAVVNGQTVTVKKTLPFISGGTLSAAAQALAGASQADERANGADVSPSGDLGANPVGQTRGTLGCDRDSNGNVRVNQDCSFRRQAEEAIAYSPANPNNLIAGQNDSRVGFNQCGIDWSTNNGQSWGDLLPPFRQKLNDPAGQEPTVADPNRHTIVGGPGTLHTYDAASDPAPAYDSQGRAYFSCVIFDVNSNASGLFVTESPKGANGSFFYNVTARNFMVVEDNSGLVVHDKNLIAADSYPNSPNRDNVYVTWTVFRFDAHGNYQRSPIFGSMSTDQGRHFSTPQEISGTSPLCFFGNFFDPTQPANACNFDQGSDPTVLPNGDLSVVFNNGNTAASNPNGQQLAVLCHPTGNSATGTAKLNCAAPTKVGDDVIVGEPQCNFGRGPEECIPGAFIRTNDFPRISFNTQNNHVFATWQDYRNGEFDIQLSESADGGKTWSEKGTVNPDRGLDHYMPAVERALVGGDQLGDSYYRTQRVPNENATPTAGFAPGQPGVQASNSDYVLAGGTPHTPFAFKVISPVFAPPDGVQAGFNGDYSGLTINKGTQAHPIWSDTRNTDPYTPTNGVVHDEDIFTDALNLPNHEDNGDGGGDNGNGGGDNQNRQNAPIGLIGRN